VFLIQVFLTNDKNLLNKALVHGILACESKTVFTTINSKLKDDTSETQSTLAQTNTGLTLPSFITSSETSPDPASPFSGFNLKRKSDDSFRTVNQNSCGPCTSFIELDMEDDPMIDYEGPVAKMRIPSLKSTVAEEGLIFQSLLDAFSHVTHVQLKSTTGVIPKNYVFKSFAYVWLQIIRWKMVEDYGIGGWEYALKVKPPWTLKTAIKCLLAHWIANFSFVFTPRGKEFVENLENLIQQHSTSSFEKIKDVERRIVEIALSLFNLADKTVMDEAPVQSCRQVLMVT
jgi:hypothetical protein